MKEIEYEEFEEMHHALVSKAFKDCKQNPRLKKKYYFYYDESNNSIDFDLSPKNLIDCYGFNTDPFKDFVLSGILSKVKTDGPSLEDLRKKLSLQPTVKEIKSSHLFKGDFLTELGEDRLTALLNIIGQLGLFIHFSIINKLYFGLSTITESMLDSEGKDLFSSPNTEKSDISSVFMGTLFLYEIAKQAPLEFSNLLKKYNYPQIEKERVISFYKEIKELVASKEQAVGNSLASLFHGDFDLYFSSFEDQLTEAIESIGEISFVEDKKIINNFASFYYSDVFLFRNSSHCFDQCDYVEKNFQDTFARNCGIRYSFVNSTDSTWIQLSDVISGLLGKAVKYANGLTLNQIEEQISSLGETQKNNLALLNKLMCSSLEFHPGLCHYIGSPKEYLKISRLLFGNTEEEQIYSFFTS